MTLQRSLAAILAGWAILVQVPAFAGETVTLCFDESEVRPWHTATGDGLNFELFNRVAGKLDIKINFQGLPWKRCLAMVQANQIDGVTAASYSAERVALGVFPGGSPPDITKRVYTDRYLLVRRKDSKIQWDGTNFQNVDGPVGAQLGYSIVDLLHSKGVPVDTSNRNATDLVRKLLAGRMTSAAMLEVEADQLVRYDPAVVSRLVIAPTPLVEKPYFMVLSHAFVKAHPALTPRLWHAIEEVRNSPEYKKLEREMPAFTIR